MAWEELLAARDLAGASAAMVQPPPASTASSRALAVLAMREVGLADDSALLTALRSDPQPWQLLAGDVSLLQAENRQRLRDALRRHDDVPFAVAWRVRIDVFEHLLAGKADAQVVDLPLDLLAAALAGNDEKLLWLGAGAAKPTSAWPGGFDVAMLRLVQAAAKPQWRRVGERHHVGWVLIEAGKPCRLSLPRCTAVIDSGKLVGWQRGLVDLASLLQPGLHRVLLVTAPPPP